MFMSAMWTTDHPKQDWRNLSPVSKPDQKFDFQAKISCLERNNKMKSSIINYFSIFIIYYTYS